uniref:Uncharacterized protein n=1 Tax=Arundo donax TaxID=35708 RepID=A0A0A9EZR4_ARUDO
MATHRANEPRELGALRHSSTAKILASTTPLLPNTAPQKAIGYLLSVPEHAPAIRSPIGAADAAAATASSAPPRRPGGRRRR